MPEKPNEIIYQLKISLRNSKPPIWRRILVPGKFSLYKLHEVIQIAMGWTDSHLHQFIINGEYYGIPSPEDFEPMINERRHTLYEIAGLTRKFVYEYDFGDSWEHEIVIEKSLPPEAGADYPVCIKGKRACPPEDVGGVWGYDNFLQALKDPKHDEHDMYIEWIGDDFDPEEFDLDSINDVLRRVK